MRGCYSSLTFRRVGPSQLRLVLCVCVCVCVLGLACFLAALVQAFVIGQYDALHYSREQRKMH